MRSIDLKSILVMGSIGLKKHIDSIAKGILVHISLVERNYISVILSYMNNGKIRVKGKHQNPKQPLTRIKILGIAKKGLKTEWSLPLHLQFGTSSVSYFIPGKE